MQCGRAGQLLRGRGFNNCAGNYEASVCVQKGSHIVPAHIALDHPQSGP